MSSTNDDMGIDFQDFVIGMCQAQHNKDNPDHRCKCKSVAEMVLRHFEGHKNGKEEKENKKS